MKSKIIRFFVVAGFLMATFTSCYKDDFDDLQKQVDELEKKVAANAASIQEQITAIQALQQQDGQLSQEIQDLVTNLEQVSDDVEQNANTVFYGNLVTDEDYAAYEAQGADVVTGKVVISTADQAAIVSNCRWVGQELITNIGAIEGIQNVGGDVVVESTDTVIDLKGLVSVGGNYHIPVNKELKSVSANDLVVLAGELRLEEGNELLTSISMENLQIVGTVNMNNSSGNVSGGAGELLNTINLNGANVVGNLTLYYVGTSSDAELSFGEVGGNIVIKGCGFGTINIDATSLYGDVTITENSSSTINFKSVTEIRGDLTVVENNGASGGVGPVGGADISGDATGLETLDFSNLVSIDGNVLITGNDLLGDILNNVQIVSEDITLNIDNADLPVIAFENLTEITSGNILLTGSMYKFTGFNKLTTMKSGKRISLGDSYLIDYNGGVNNKRIYDAFLVKSGDAEALNVFNGLENMDGELIISTYYHGYTYYVENGYVDMGKSFTNLSYIKTFKLYLFDRYGSDLYNAFPAVTTIENLYIYGEEKYSYGSGRSEKVECDADFSNSFANLETIEKKFDTYSGLWGSISGLNVVNIGQLNIGSVKYLEMPELKALTNRYGNSLRAYAVGLDVEFPKLDSVAYKLTIQTMEEGGDISVNMPMLSKCPEVYVNFGSYAPNSFSAPLPMLSELNKLTIYYKKAVIDASELLTGLTTVNTYAKLYYLSGQTFCGMKDLLPTLAGPKLYLYKDGSYTPISDGTDEDAEIVLLTSGC